MSQIRNGRMQKKLPYQALLLRQRGSRSMQMQKTNRFQMNSTTSFLTNVQNARAFMTSHSVLPYVLLIAVFQMKIMLKRKNSFFIKRNGSMPVDLETGKLT